MKSRIFIFIFLAFAVVILSSAYIQQSAEQLYQSGLYKEEVEGELEKAIEIYERIIKDFPGNKATAAKALYHIGLCYEKLGNKEAQKAYQRLIDEYPGQIQEVNLAKERLASLVKAAETVPQKPNFRKIRIPTGLNLGVQISPDGKSFAYTSEGSIWLVPIAGKVDNSITGTPVRLYEPMEPWAAWGPISWSWDGQWIAFNLESDDDNRMAVISSKGGEPKLVSVERYGGGTYYFNRISLSPDGKILGFASKPGKKLADAGVEEEKLSIYTLPVNGGDITKVTEEAKIVIEPTFSPDGKKIAYRKFLADKFGSEIYIKPLGSDSSFLVSGDPQLLPRGPIWSPDGENIAFECMSSVKDYEEYENKEIWIVPLSKEGRPNAAPTKIKMPKKNRYGISSLIGWTTDNKIGLLIENPKYMAVYTVPVSGGKAVQITPPGGVYDPRWSPDGKKIFYAEEGNIYSVPAKGGEVAAVQLQSDTNFVLPPPGSGNNVSPDGNTIVFSAFRRESPERKKGLPGVHVWTMPVVGGEPTQLTESFYNPRWPCWSPDGKRIAFVSYREISKKEFTANIYTVPKKGGTPRQLTSESDQVFWGSISWSPDGKCIAYLSKDKTIKIKPVEGGEPKTLTKINELNYHKELTWSPDSQKIAYTSYEHIWIVPVDGGKPVELKTGLDGSFIKISWSPNGRSIAFTAAQGGELELWLMEDFLPLVKRK